jgi:hypothetical protein
MSRSRSTLSPTTPSFPLRGKPVETPWALWRWVSGVLVAARLVAFRAFDGRTLTGLLIDAGARLAAAVVVVPMLGWTKDD